MELGAGLNEEEAELMGEGSREEAVDSMQRAESMELVELLRVLALRFASHGCWRHFAAVSRFLGVGERGGSGHTRTACTHTHTHRARRVM